MFRKELLDALELWMCPRKLEHSTKGGSGPSARGPTCAAASSAASPVCVLG